MTKWVSPAFYLTTNRKRGIVAPKRGEKMQKKILILSLVVTMVAMLSPAFADNFNLSYTLTEGGSELQLDSSNPYRGVQISVQSDTTRYEIWQDIVMPFENRDVQGETLGRHLVMRKIEQGTSNGTFYVQSSDVAVSSVKKIYTSNAAGAVNFTLVYGITGIEDLEPGHYYGKIRYTLKPIGSAREEVPRYLEAYVTISQKPGVAPDIEIIPATGLGSIYLNPQKPDKQAFDVQVKINRKTKNFFSITQVLSGPLESAEGNQLDYPAVNYVTSGVSQGTSVNRITPFSLGRMDIYNSGPNGKADDNFIITYGLGDFSQVRAGRYRGRLNYYLERLNQPPKLLNTLEVEVENSRVFDLLITPQEQKTRIEFQNLQPKEPPRVSEMIIEIKSNLGKPYQVSQNLLSELTDTKGTLKTPEKQAMKKQDTVLFVSDAKGSADKFKIIYELTSPDDLIAGDYSTRITYALLEI